MDTSSQVSPQVSIPEDAEPEDLTLEETSLPNKAFGLGTGILPVDVVQLQEDAGKALGCLLMIRSSFDALLQKQVSDFKMALHKNESETTKALKEAKTLCTCTIREAKAQCTMLISEAETLHVIFNKEAKANHVFPS